MSFSENNQLFNWVLNNWLRKLLWSTFSGKPHEFICKCKLKLILLSSEGHCWHKLKIKKLNWFGLKTSQRGHSLNGQPWWSFRSKLGPCPSEQSLHATWRKVLPQGVEVPLKVFRRTSVNSLCPCQPPGLSKTHHIRGNFSPIPWAIDCDKFANYLIIPRSAFPFSEDKLYLFLHEKCISLVLFLWEVALSRSYTCLLF